MTLGAFSMSLSVNNLADSRTFYEALGFKVFHDQSQHGWLIMQCGDSVIGLFEGMFEGNIMTFNPGWDQNGQAIDPFNDVRAIEQSLRDQGVEISSGTQSDEGPDRITLTDPDGNVIMVDQHR